MKIIKLGEDRLVIKIPLLGIVVKIAIIHFFLAAKFIYNKGLLWSFKIPADNRSFIDARGYLFKGLLANWREFLFYLQTRHPFLCPTYFSIGIINVQAYGGNPCQITRAELKTRLNDITNEEIYDDPHHFTNPEHFCFRHGKIQMIDYGSPPTQSVIKKWGDKIIKEFIQL